MGAYCCLGWLLLVEGEHSLVLPGWFKADDGVKHSLAMWTQPWHPKHWREWVSATGCTLPLTLGLQLPWSLHWLPIPSTPCSVSRLLAGVAWPGPPLPLWEPGWLGVPLPLCPHSWGLPSALWDCCPIQSGSGQPLIGQSVVPTWPFPPLVWLSLWP